MKKVKYTPIADAISKPKRTRKSDLEALERDQRPSGGLGMVYDEDGGVTIDLNAIDKGEVEPTPIVDYNENDHYRNLVGDVDHDTLMLLGSEVVDTANADQRSRQDWTDTITKGFELLGISLEEKNYPFQGACSAQHPLLMESAVKFQSKASNELLPANGPCRGKILGDLTVEKEEQANRVQNHMNYQITEEMTEFYVDSERMLLYLPLVGSGFKKVYYDSYLERPCSEFVPADQLIVPNTASDLHRCERYTQQLNKTKYQLEADFATGLYEKPKELGDPGMIQITEVSEKANDLVGLSFDFENNKGYTLFEQHIVTCIEGLDEPRGKKPKLAKPYIITVDKDSRTVLGIRRNWKEGDKKCRKKVMFVHYQFVPGFGFYGLGFLHLLGNLQLSLTSSLRSLVDAGQFANLQGGFKLKGVRIINDGEPIHPGQFKDIDAAIMDINKSIMPLPFKEPSQTLYQMLEFLDRKGQKFADSTEQVIADSTNYGPVGTTLALLDASTKFFSAIHKRLHASLKQELKAIAEINAETLPDDLEYNVENATMAVSRKDYDDTVDVIPVSDPNISSNAHRMTKAQTVMQIAMQTPELHDMREVLKHVYVNMDFADYKKILPDPEEAQQNDPMTDIMVCVNGRPIKAFEGQDHQSHIAIKQAFLNDPISGKNLIMQKAGMAIQSNIQEHMVLSFMEQTKAQAATAPAQEGADPMVAAAQQVAQMNQQKAQRDAEAAQGGDAAMLLAKAELLDTEVNARKQKFDEVYKTAELNLRTQMLDMDKIKEANKAVQFDKKIVADMDKMVQTKGIEAMVEGLRQRNDKANPESKSKPPKKDK